MGIKPGDSGVVIDYQVDEFTHTWSAEQFVACSHIYPGFTVKVSSLTHFPLELGCEEYSFLDQAVADFEQSLDSILTNSLEAPELVASLDEPDAFLVNCGARLKLFLHLCLWLPRCQHSNWFVIFLGTLQLADSSHQLHLITSPWLLLTGRLISLYQICWLVLVLLLMQLLTQSNSSPVSEMPFLILFPLYLILREALYMCLKCLNYFSRFMTFWTMLFPNK